MFPSQKFLFFVLKSSDVLDILVPILYYLNDARADQCESPLFLHFNKLLLDKHSLTCSVMYPCCSTCWAHAYWGVHFAAVEWREKLWRALE